jgi:ABC-2 type transport system ATP-binding protein
VDLEAPGPALEIDGATVTRIDGPRQWLRFHRDSHTAASLLSQVTAQAPVRDITVEEPAIDDIIRHIYSSTAGRQPHGLG